MPELAIKHVPMWVADKTGPWHVCAWREMQGEHQHRVMTGCGTLAWGWPRSQKDLPERICRKCRASLKNARLLDSAVPPTPRE